MSESPQPRYVLCVWVPALERYTPALGCPPQYDVRAARLQERERCAKVARDKAEEWGKRWREGEKDDRLAGMSDGASIVDAAIRALPEGE